MGLPQQPVTLGAEQIEAIVQKLSTLRHDINGDLALIVAAAELIRLNPASADRMLGTVLEQPSKIRRRTDQFSAELEQMLGVSRGQQN